MICTVFFLRISRAETLAMGLNLPYS